MYSQRNLGLVAAAAAEGRATPRHGLHRGAVAALLRARALDGGNVLVVGGLRCVAFEEVVELGERGGRGGQGDAAVFSAG